MNSLARVSAVLTNGSYMFNLDCDHYINNNKALREAMCFLMDPNLGGHDGMQGPIYVGTGCVFNRTTLYGYAPPMKSKDKKDGFLSSLCGDSRKNRSKSNKSSDKKKSSKHVDNSILIFNLKDIEEGVEGAGFDDEMAEFMSEMSLEKKFGQSSVFVASTLMEHGGVPQSATPESRLKEAIHVINFGYEDETYWGNEDEVMKKKNDYLENMIDLYPEGTPMDELVVVPNVGTEIMEDVIGCECGRMIRGAGKIQVPETNSSSSSTTTSTVLNKEMQELQAQLQMEKKARMRIIAEHEEQKAQRSFVMQ